jgi:nucleoside-diphosphate-sugar epimerase
MTTVAVTGVGGLLGRALVTSLRREPGDVTRIVGLDVAPPVDLLADRPLDGPAPGPAPGPERVPNAAERAPDLELLARDIRDADLAEAFDGIDVLVHLAFQMDPIRDVARMHAINVDGTMNVLEAARAAGVGRVIYLSSVVAYGAHADNDLPLTEVSPLRGQPGFTYAEHKCAVEDRIWPWHAAGDGPALTVLRSAAVFGPGVQNFLTRVLELPVLPELPDAPPLQFVHVDDVISAIVHALRTPLDGAFNVAPDGWLDFARVLTLVGRPTVALGPDALRRIVERAHRVGIGELEVGVVELFRHPWVLANDRLRATGWAPERTNEETLLETVLEHERYVALGRLRMTRGTLRAAMVAAAAGLAAASVAALRRR